MEANTNNTNMTTATISNTKCFSDLSKQLIHLRRLREKIDHVNDDDNDNKDNDNIKKRIRNKINNNTNTSINTNDLKNNAINLNNQLNGNSNNNNDTNYGTNNTNDTVTKSPTRINRTQKYSKYNNNNNNDNDTTTNINNNTTSNVSNNDNSILQATVKLLLQSIEEQGRLRTLIEYTNDPNILIKQVENHLISIINNTNTNTSSISSNNTNNNTSTRDIANDNIKLRGTLIELERTIMQMIKIKQDYDNDYSIRVEIEKELVVAHDQIKKKDNEIDIIKSQYRRLQSLYDQQQIQLNEMFNSKMMIDKYPPPPTSPLPPPDDDDDDGNDDDKDDGNHQQYNTNNESKQQHSSSLLLDIDIGGGRTDRVMVTENSDPLMLAFNFLREHALPPSYLEPLSSYISSMRETLFQDQANNSTNGVPNGVSISPSAKSDSSGKGVHITIKSPTTPNNDDLNYSSSSNASLSPISISVSRDLSMSKDIKASSPLQESIIISSPNSNELKTIEQSSPIFSPPPPPPPPSSTLLASPHIMTSLSTTTSSAEKNIQTDDNDNSTFYISNVSSDCLTNNDNNDSKFTVNDSKDDILVYSQSESDIKINSNSNREKEDNSNVKFVQDNLNIDTGAEDDNEKSELYETISDDSTSAFVMKNKKSGLSKLRRSRNNNNATKSPKNEELFEKAVNTFDTATDLVNGGNIEAAIPLYHNALYLFELTGLDEIDAIRNEVNYWTNYATEKRNEKSNTLKTNVTTNATSNVTTTNATSNATSNATPNTVTFKNTNDIATTTAASNSKGNNNSNTINSNSKAIINTATTASNKSRIMESNRRLQSLADMKRNSTTNVKPNAATTNDITLSPQIIYNNYMNDLHKQQSIPSSNRAGGSSSSSSRRISKRSSI